MEHKTKSAAESIADGDVTAPPASRISTMMPLLRRAVAVMIGLTAALAGISIRSL